MGDLMNLQKYLALIKAVEYGSLTKAAQSLNYTQSGISRMIGDRPASAGAIYYMGRLRHHVNG